MALVRSLVRGVCGVGAAGALLGLAWGLGGTAWAASHWPWLSDNRWLLVQYVIDGAGNGLIIALIALGYTMVYGIVELINFAHGDLTMLGCFLTLTLIGACRLDRHPVLGLCLLLTAAPLFCGALNWGVERFAYRPMRSAPKLATLVTAIGVSFVFVNLGLFWGGVPMEAFGGGTAAASPKSVPELVSGVLYQDAGGNLLITNKDLLVACVTLPLMAALTAFVSGTRLGTAMRASAQNPVAARLMGIDVDRVIAATFAIGGALAGVAAVVYSLYNNSINFQMGYRLGMDAFTAAVLGGIGNLPGAVVGGLLIGLVRSFCEGYVGPEWSNISVFATLILALVFRPSGLLGAHVREKV